MQRLVSLRFFLMNTQNRSEQLAFELGGIHQKQGKPRVPNPFTAIDEDLALMWDAGWHDASPTETPPMTLEQIQRRRHYTKNDTDAEATIRKAVDQIEASGVGGVNSTRAINLLHMARELRADDVDAALEMGAPLAIMQEGPNFAEGLAKLYGAALAEAGAPMDGTDPEELMEWAARAGSALANAQDEP